MQQKEFTAKFSRYFTLFTPYSQTSFHLTFSFSIDEKTSRIKANLTTTITEWFPRNDTQWYQVYMHKIYKLQFD